MQKFKNCTGLKHCQPCVDSPHPRDKVPAELFLKDPEDPQSRVFSTCLDCRECKKRLNAGGIQKKKELAQKSKSLVLAGKSKFMHCLAHTHGVSGSPHPVTKVPVVLFRRYPEDPASELYKYCLECRNYNQTCNQKFVMDHKKKAESQGKFYCKMCCLKLPLEKRSKNLNGTDSKVCEPCKNIVNQRNAIQVAKFAEAYRNLKYEFIRKYECSCQKCKRIYFQPKSQESLVVSCIDTYLKDDGRRYAIYKNKECLVSDILDKELNQLELNIVEFDHLPEIEQRERGLLAPNEPFNPKENQVSQMGTIRKMRLESKKCQHVCSRCHIEETMRREKGGSPKGAFQKLKETYVAKIKSKGCESCGYVNAELLRFFDMDHLDPNDKIQDICILTRDKDCTLEMLEEECRKCRVLCKFCHQIHSKRQRQEKRRLALNQDELDPTNNAND